MSGEASVWFDLLDQQIVDADDLPIGRVEDLELDVAPDEPAAIASLLTGTQALGERMDGIVARWIASASARLRGAGSRRGPTPIAVGLVEAVGVSVRLRARHDELPEVAPLEHWLSEHVVGRIPGAGDARE